MGAAHSYVMTKLESDGEGLGEGHKGTHSVLYAPEASEAFVVWVFRLVVGGEWA